MTNSDIEIKILELFCSDKTGPFKAVDVQRILPALVRPGMAVAVMSGEYEVSDNSGIIKETARLSFPLLSRMWLPKANAERLCTLR